MIAAMGVGFSPGFRVEVKTTSGRGHSPEELARRYYNPG